MLLYQADPLWILQEDYDGLVFSGKSFQRMLGAPVEHLSFDSVKTVLPLKLRNGPLVGD